MPSTPKRQASESRFPRRRLPLAFLALGVLALVLPQAFSLAMFTSGSSSSIGVAAAADWTPPMVTLDDVPDAIRGTVTLSATATDGETGVKNVAFMWRTSDPVGNWTTICTDAVAPYSCAFNTVGLAEGEIDIRAFATDNSGYTGEDIDEAVLVDNTAPTGSLNTIASPIAGAITITAVATDDGSGVDNVVFQRATAGGSTWTTICADIDTPYTCKFDSTQVALGYYDFRAVITDEAGNTFTTAKQANKLVNNIASSVSVDDPDDYLRGTVTITANGNAALGVASIRIQKAPFGTTTWTDICTDNSSPFSCSWNTTTVTDGQYIFRAIMTDTIGATTTSATVGPSTVDNSAVRGYDVQTTSGGSAGKPSTGDTITVTYTRPMKTTSILTGWAGGSQAVVVRFRDGKLLGLTNNDDTVDVFTTTGFTVPVNIGSIDLKLNYIKQNKTVAFNATMTQSTVTVNGQSATALTFTIGTVATGYTASNTRTASSTVNMIWTPSSVATDTTGIATSASPITELGTKDRDF